MNILNIFKNHKKVYFPLFNKEIAVTIKEDVEKTYADKCFEHLNNLSQKTINKLCEASIEYYKEHLDEPDNNIEGKEILKHIYPKVIIIDKPQNKKIYYKAGTTDTGLDYKIGYRIELDCDWEKEHGLEWTINENKVLYVGKCCNVNAWKSDEHYKEISYNYVNKIKLADIKRDNIEIDETKRIKFKELIDEYKKLTEKECYSINLIDEEPEILDNKIGGKPYLPIGEEYPIDKFGNPMELLLQINLNDIQLKDWPKSGILEIFISLAEDDYEYNCAIKLFKANLEYQTTFPEITFSYPTIKQGYKIKLTKNICHMPISDNRFNDTIWSIIERVYNIKKNASTPLYKIFGSTKWNEELSSLINNHLVTIGGYPEFVDAPLYDEDDNKIEILFKLDPNINPSNFDIIEQRILNVIIYKDDILSLNFNNVKINY